MNTKFLSIKAVLGSFWPLRPLAASEIVESASAGSLQLVQVIICQIKKISFLALFKVPKTPCTKFFFTNSKIEVIL